MQVRHKVIQYHCVAKLYMFASRLLLFLLLLSSMYDYVLRECSKCISVSCVHK